MVTMLSDSVSSFPTCVTGIHWSSSPATEDLMNLGKVSRMVETYGPDYCIQLCSSGQCQKDDGQ